MAKERSRNRLSSLFSLGTAKSDDDSTGQSPGSLRPAPVSRDPSPGPHLQTSFQEGRTSNVAHQRSPIARDVSPHGSAPPPSFTVGQSPGAQGLRAIDTTHLPPSFAAQYEGSPSFTPGSGPSSGPDGRSSFPPGIPENDSLPPPPPIGASSTDRTSKVSGRASSLDRGRTGSLDRTSLPGSRTASPAREWLRPSTPDVGRLVKKKSWIPGRGQNRTDSESRAEHGPTSGIFVVGPQGRQPYDSIRLRRAQPVTELWNEHGNLLVHLFGKNSGPSFKVDMNVISSSRRLLHLLRGGVSSRNSSVHRHQGLDQQFSALSFDSDADPSDVPRYEDPGAQHLYMPLSLTLRTEELPPDRLETLVSARNLFAFLVGQVLVGTPRQPTLFSIFKNIAGLLERYEFTNMDGSTLGESATASFLGYVEDLRLDDIRASREKITEAIVLGERMKCWPLYNEGYVHGVGRWDGLLRMNHPLLQQVSPITQKRMEKSSMDLFIRLKGVRTRLNDFEFPSLFAGVAASSASAKIVDFKSWRMAFVAMRKHTMNVYKIRYGSWPPKANSKKNEFEESGLNRILLQELYQDFSDLYDMLVDRKSLTTRSVDATAHDEILSPDPSTHHLRKLLSEFDRSTPPVQPPVPYDVPKIPDLGNTRRGFNQLPVRKQEKERGKRLKDDEINMALMQSYNRESVKVTPFLESFMTFERNMAHGKSIDEMAQIRIGQWIFLYVVLQSLPMVVVDAPGLRWTRGVEYFLCEVPKGFPPWMKEDNATQMAYYRVAGGAGVVSLPVDVVDFGVEGIYHRSHCWEVAAQWANDDPEANQEDPQLQPERIPTPVDIPPPPKFGDEGIEVGDHSGRSSKRNSYRNSLALGLEAFPLPASMVNNDLSSGVRKASQPDPSKNFESMLGPSTPVKKKH